MQSHAMLALVACALCVGMGTPADEDPGLEQVTVGVLITLSEGAAGVDVARGARLAVDEVNAAGGIAGRPVVLVIENDHGSPADAAQAYVRLAYEVGARLVLGPISPDLVLPLAPLAHRAECALVVPGGAGALAHAAGSPWVLPAQRTGWMGALAEWISKQGESGAPVVVLHDDTLKGRERARAFDQALQFRGCRTQIARVPPGNLDAPPRTIALMLDDPAAARRTLTALRDLDPCPPVVVAPELVTDEIAALSSPTGVTIVGPCLPGMGDPSEAYTAFVEKYEAAYGERPSVLAAFAYDAMAGILSTDAIGLDRCQVRDELASMSPFAGVTGSVSFGAQDARANGTALVIARGGAFELLGYDRGDDR